MGNSAAITAAFGGSLPHGISGTNDRCTLLVSNLNSDVSSLLAFKLLLYFPVMRRLELGLQFFNFWVFSTHVCAYQTVDEDKLFNLFSIYGNIVRIKILRNKPDHALVQMGDGFQAELAVHFLKVQIQQPF